MSTYESKEPLREALAAITGSEPPLDLIPKGAYSSDDCPNPVALQDWCSMNARPEWATGLGILEAAELIVREAVENANIPPQETES